MEREVAEIKIAGDEVIGKTEADVIEVYDEGQLRRAWRRHRERIICGLGVSSIVCLLIAAMIAVELISDYSTYAAMLDARLANQSLQQPAGIYAAPRRLSIGQRIDQEELKMRLLRAGYQSGEQADSYSTGSFIAEKEGVAIHTSPGAAFEGTPLAVSIGFSRGQITSIKDYETGARLESIRLPAEMLTASLSTRRQSRLALSLNEIPKVLIDALCAIEDRRFFSHGGVDLRAVARAALNNLRRGGIHEGGSTITQQLIKNQFLTAKRTWSRKYTEAMMAIALERRLTKEQILSLYCDRIYLGQSGQTAIYGFKEAARLYLGKQLSELTIAEAAFLAGLVKAPNRYGVQASPKTAKARRDLVLEAMVDAGYIDRGRAEAAKAEQLVLHPPPPPDDAAAPHFVDHVVRQLDRQLGGGIDRTRVRIETTLDLDLQQAAGEVVGKHLKRLSKAVIGGRSGAQPEAALIALDPKSGEILAMIGGSNYAASQFNRATDAQRQPGSAFKPVVYAAALTEGVSPVTTYVNAPQVIEYGHHAVYRPENYGRAYSQAPVTLHEALVRSLNVVTVEAAMQVGLGDVAQMAARLGLPPPEAYPSLALGAFEVTPLELARAYTAFANRGVRVDPFPIRAIKYDSDLIVSNETTKAGVLSPTFAYMVTDALSDAVNRGTGGVIRRMGYRGPAAGKTGSSRDAWFVGYTPKLLVVVWVGYDDHTDLGLTGSQAAAPIWADFAKRALELRPDLAAEAFERPAGLWTAVICSDTGTLANEYCERREDLLLPAYLIPGRCLEHEAPAFVLEEAFYQPASSGLKKLGEGIWGVLINPDE